MLTSHLKTLVIRRTMPIRHKTKSILRTFLPMTALSLLACDFLERSVEQYLHVVCRDREIVFIDGVLDDTVKIAHESTGYRFEEQANVTVTNEQVIVHGWGYPEGHFADSECSEPKWCGFDTVLSRAGSEHEGSELHLVRYVAIADCYAERGTCKKAIEKGSSLRKLDCKRAYKK